MIAESRESAIVVDWQLKIAESIHQLPISDRQQSPTHPIRQLPMPLAS
ncbi:MAG: hypothetical protein IT178_18050 [Acidobacteria bacterium]|nr:hypothetical protein [Acidobacteriota bacterium]